MSIKRYSVVCAGALIAAACMLSIAPRASGQVLYGSVVGQVLDSSNAPIPGAAVKIQNTQTGESRSSITNEAGGFSFPTVASGTYDVNVTRDGFQTYSARGLSVTVDSVVRVDATLRVGSLSETVTVSEAGATLQTDRAETRAEVTTADLENIPVPIGRNYQNLLIVVPGLTPPANQHSVAANPSRGLTFNVNGGTRNSNNVRIDGALSNNVWLPHVTSYVPGLEAIREVSVVTSTFDADQGLSGSVAVNVQIKSGTNALHGSAFEYHTDNALKAKPFFLPIGQRKPKNIDNQFGGTMGGPIRKDKIFFFGSYDGTFDRQTGSTFVTVPTAAIRAGDMSASSTAIYDPSTGAADGSNRTPFGSNLIPAARIDSISQKLVGLTPLPNVPGNLLQNNYYATGGYNVTRHKTDAKVNYNVTDKLTVNGRVGWLNYNFVDPPAFGDAGGPPVSSAGGKIGNGFGNTYSTTLSATYVVRPSLIVDGYFGWTIENTNQEPPRIDENLGQTFLGLPGTNGPTRSYGGWPQISVNSYATLGNPGSGSAGGPIYYKDRQYQYTANATWTKGTHSVRFGADLARQELNHFETTSSAGAFNFSGGPTTIRGGASSNQFNDYAAFLLGLTSSVNHDLLPFDNAQMTSRDWLISLFVRDQWQVSRKVTLSLGVRWDYFPMGTRATRGMERYNFDTNQMTICGVGGQPRDCGYQIGKRYFSPRVGIAWRPTETFVVRTGYGINFDPYPLAFVRDMFTNYPEDLFLTVSPPNSFVAATQFKDGIPTIVAPDLSKGLVTVPTTYATRSLPDHVGRGYVQSWNLSLQKQLQGGFVAQLAYVGSRQVGITQRYDLNAQRVGGGAASQIYNQKFGRTAATELLTSIGHNDYDSLQTGLQRRFSKGLTLNASYTFSKVIGICCDDLSDGNPRIQDPNYFGLNRALMPYDRTHNFTSSVMYELPLGKGKPWLNRGGMASAIAGGWQINALFTRYSGSPFDVTASGTSLNASGNTQRADLVKPHVEIVGGTGPGQSYFDPLAFAQVTAARFGTAGYSILRGPGTTNLDFSLFRDFHITERVKAQFRGEAFNLSNTPHFANPAANVSNLQTNPDGSVRNLGGYTVITSTTGTGREGVDERVFRFGLRISF
jgi:Carboxypeptidase regulatory-like domain/TonB dependent receptor-like, beta-barrel